MKLTPSQQAVIDHRGSNLLVSASAGSGKTEVLARRCVALIANAEQPCPVERLLVVTFTRAAAAELRVRLGRMLREEAEQTRAPKLREHLRRQEVLVGAADISTIDAWCGRIVRAHSAQAGIDAEFAVLAEEDARLLRRQVLDELFEWVYTSQDQLAADARAWLGRHCRTGDDFLRELVTGLNGFREHLVEPERWFAQQHALCAQGADALRADAAVVLAAALARECASQSSQLAALLRDAEQELREALEPIQQTLTDWATRLAPGDADGLRAVVTEITDLKPKKSPKLPAPAAALFDEIKQRWLKGRLQKQWPPADVEKTLTGAPAAAALVATLLALEEHYQERLAAAKRAQAAYEFGDVLRMALDLLGTSDDAGPRQPTDVARRLRERYEHILIDEYQDTSPVQAEILRLVTRDEPGCTNRFMVGDVKQSIYGFRQAEPRLFSDLVTSFEQRQQEGEVKHLADNFRSHPDLLSGFNQLFAMLLDPTLGGTAFDQAERLRAAREEIANPTWQNQPRIDLRIFEAERGATAFEDEESDDVPPERVEREATVAAQTIREMLDAGVMVPERDAGGQLTLRPLRLSDIVILLRSAKGNAALVAGTLRTAGIPSRTAGRDALFHVPEVADLRNVLALLANRRQDVALAAYLRSPMVGLAAAEMQQIRDALPHGDYYDAVTHYCGWRDDGDGPAAPENADAGLTVKLRDALQQLERWGEFARDEELPELLRRILHESGLALFAAALPGGEHRVALLRTIETFAADFARQGQHGVAEFVAYLDDLAAAEIEPGLPVPAGEDVVRIMTIHAAKGLEFPVVFLLNAGSRFNLSRAKLPLHCDEAEGLGLRFYDYPARAPLVSARHETIRQRVMQRDIEEELRLLYVALTRARERLLIFGHTTPGRWDDVRAQCEVQPGPPPLATRLAVHNALNWVMLATAAARLHEAAKGDKPLVQVTTLAASEIKPTEKPQIAPAAPFKPWDATDDAWLSRAGGNLKARADQSVSALPAVLSVSAIKELLQRAGDEDAPHDLDRAPATLASPAFAATVEPDGRAVGTACHRFLQRADLRSLESEAAIGKQIEALVQSGWLAPADAAMIPIADVAWFGGTPTGQLLRGHAGALRRELPFVFALPIGQHEATIVRGIIDCVLDTDAGLIIVDYKTDRVKDEAALAARIDAYSNQMRLYAQAAERILARPVSQALLVFLHARRVVTVSCTPVGLDALQAAPLSE